MNVNVWVTFSCVMLQGQQPNRISLWDFQLPGIFNVRTGSPSVSPLSEKAIRSIHYPRIRGKWFTYTRLLCYGMWLTSSYLTECFLTKPLSGPHPRAVLVVKVTLSLDSRGNWTHFQRWYLCCRTRVYPPPPPPAISPLYTLQISVKQYAHLKHVGCKDWAKNKHRTWQRWLSDQ